MFYYIDQPCTQSVLIGLVKTESDFIVRLVEISLGRWTLVLAVISADAYPFLASQTWPFTLRMQELVFSGGFVPPDSEETELGSSNQEAFSSAGKNSRVVLVPCLHMEVRPYSYFWWCGYFWGPWVSFVTTDKFSVRVRKITSWIGVSWTHSLLLYF